MNVVFRADASLEIGTGHIMRCLTLAEGLRKKGAKCFFVARELQGNLIALIRQKEFDVFPLGFGVAGQKKSESGNLDGPPPNPYSHWVGVTWQEDAIQTISEIKELEVDWLIVDHYSLDSDWETLMRPYCKKILVIDDLANRAHSCELLLNQNLGSTALDYSNLVPESCGLLIGPQFALLRPEFLNLRPYSLKRRTKPKIMKILISMGGVDINNVTGKILSSLKTCKLPNDAEITIVLGKTSPWFLQLQILAQNMSWKTTILVGVENMAQLMSDSDIAIGAAGISVWERCCLGVPTITVATTNNQSQNAKFLSLGAYSLVISRISEIATNFSDALDQLSSSKQMASLSKSSSSLVDGLGLNRVLNHFSIETEHIMFLRDADINDERLLHKWANEFEVRKNSFSSSKIEFEEHRNWFRSRLNSKKNCIIFITEHAGGRPIGQVRFENYPEENAWLIDYSVDLPFRRLGLSREMLKTSIKSFRVFQPESDIVGKVKVNNVASCKVFRALNFTEEYEAKQEIIVFRKGL